MFDSICSDNQHFDDAIAEREWLIGRDMMSSSLLRPISTPIPKPKEDPYFYPDYICINGKAVKIKYKSKND